MRRLVHVGGSPCTVRPLPGHCLLVTNGKPKPAEDFHRCVLALLLLQLLTQFLHLLCQLLYSGDQYLLPRRVVLVAWFSGHGNHLLTEQIYDYVLPRQMTDTQALALAPAGCASTPRPKY